MTAVYISVDPKDTKDCAQLFELERELFPGEQLIEFQDGHHVLSLSGPRARYVLDVLGIGAEDRLHQPFDNWARRDENQFPLEFKPTPRIDWLVEGNPPDPADSPWRHRQDPFRLDVSLHTSDRPAAEVQPSDPWPKVG